MSFLKKIAGFGIAAAITFSLTSSLAFGEEKEILKISSVRVSDILKNNSNDSINLDEFIKDKEFDKCYGNQLDENSKIIYDALVDNAEMSKSGVESIGEDKYLKDINFYDEDKYLAEYNYIKIPNFSVDQIAKDNYAVVKYAVMAFDYDYPEIFWLDFNKILFMPVQLEGDSNTYITFILDDYYDNYYCNGYDYANIYSPDKIESDINEIKRVCDEVHNAVNGKSDYQKVEYINHYLISKNEYNRSLLQVNRIEDEEQRNAELDRQDGRLWKCTSALIYGTPEWEPEEWEPEENSVNLANPVCEGYSRAFKLLCNNEKIECFLVSGTEFKDDGSSEPHMWNYVKMPDDKWYAVDCTFNDPVFDKKPSEKEILLSERKVFICGSNVLFKNHSPETDNVYYEAGIDDNGVKYPGVNGLSYPVLSEEDYPIIGDVNKDRFVDFADASELLDNVLDGTIDEYHKTVADFDKTKEDITASDVAMLIEFILNQN